MSADGAPAKPDPRPKSNVANIASAVIALVSLFCAGSVLSVTAENQCADRKERKILQQPLLRLKQAADNGEMYLRNYGPGTALIKSIELFYDGRALPSWKGGDDYEQYALAQSKGKMFDFLWHSASLYLLEDAANLCGVSEERKEGCLSVSLSMQSPRPNSLMPIGESYRFLKVDNFDEIKARVSSDKQASLDKWRDFFSHSASNNVDFRITYCPISNDFGSCQVLKMFEDPSLPIIPECRTGLRALLPF